MLYPQRLHGEQCCTTSEVPDAAIQQDGPGIPLLPFPLNPTLFVTEQTHVQTMERRLILSSCPLPHTPHATPYTRLPSRHRRDPPTLGRPARAKAIGARKSWHRQWCHKQMIMNYTVVFTHPRLYTQDSKFTRDGRYIGRTLCSPIFCLCPLADPTLCIDPISVHSHTY